MNRALVLGAVLAGAAVPALSATTVYTNRTNWETATGSWTTETFTGNTVNTAGVTYVTNSGYFNISGDVVHDQLEGGESTTWNFAFPIVSWGADFNLAGPGGPGSGIAVSIELYLGNTLQSVATMPGSTNNFWGFTSTQAFDSIRLAHPGSTGSIETYDMDNMSFNDNVIPLPQASGMALAGLGILSLRRRRAALA